MPRERLIEMPESTVDDLPDEPDRRAGREREQLSGVTRPAGSVIFPPDTATRSSSPGTRPGFSANV